MFIYIFLMFFIFFYEKNKLNKFFSELIKSMHHIGKNIHQNLNSNISIIA
jgi:hypothetical protein